MHWLVVAWLYDFSGVVLELTECCCSNNVSTGGRPSVLDPRLGLFDDSDAPSRVDVANKGFHDHRPSSRRVSTRNADAAVEVSLSSLGCTVALFQLSSTPLPVWQQDTVFVIAVKGIEVTDQITASPLNRVLGYGVRGGDAHVYGPVCSLCASGCKHARRWSPECVQCCPIGRTVVWLCKAVPDCVYCTCLRQRLGAWRAAGFPLRTSAPTPSRLRETACAGSGSPADWPRTV